MRLQFGMPLSEYIELHNGGLSFTFPDGFDLTTATVQEISDDVEQFGYFITKSTVSGQTITANLKGTAALSGMVTPPVDTVAVTVILADVVNPTLAGEYQLAAVALDADGGLLGNAVYTAAGDTAAGLLGGLAIFPAVFALGMSPASGPDLVFATLPDVFAAMPAGALLGALFFAALAAVAFLSDVAAFEVLVAGLTDNTGLPRRTAVVLVAAIVFLFSLTPMINMELFVPWDLAFGSGLQMGGALLAALCVGWALDRGAVLEELARRGKSGRGGAEVSPWLYRWIRYVIPGAIGLVAAWWLASDVLELA